MIEFWLTFVSWWNSSFLQWIISPPETNDCTVPYQVEGSTAAGAAVWQTAMAQQQSSMYSLAGQWTQKSRSGQARTRQQIKRRWNQIFAWPRWNADIMWSHRKRPTLLSLATASEMDVLKSSGLFWARVVIRLVAAVTTPWKQSDSPLYKNTD